jgi:hypothetical protein
LAAVDVQDLAGDVGRGLQEQDAVYYVADLLHRVSAIDMPGFVANGEHLEWIAWYNASAAASRTRATSRGAKWGAIIGRHWATLSRLKRSISGISRHLAAVNHIGRL